MLLIYFLDNMVIQWIHMYDADFKNKRDDACCWARKLLVKDHCELTNRKPVGAAH